jgi:hypothetical protein
MLAEKRLGGLIPMLVGAVTILTFFGGWATWVDTRYEHTEAALRWQHEVTAHAAQQEQYDEQGRLELDLQIKQLKLNQLRGKNVKSQDDLDEIAYLVDAITLLRKRLEGLSK